MRTKCGIFIKGNRTPRVRVNYAERRDNLEKRILKFNN
jgi:hypothetical protein